MRSWLLRDVTHSTWVVTDVLGPTGCPENLVTNCQSTLRNFPQKQRSQECCLFLIPFKPALGPSQGPARTHPVSYAMCTDGRFRWEYSGRSVRATTGFHLFPKLRICGIHLRSTIRLLYLYLKDKGKGAATEISPTFYFQTFAG
jgi:hypothetical protein